MAETPVWFFGSKEEVGFFDYTPFFIEVTNYSPRGDERTPIINKVVRYLDECKVGRKDPRVISNVVGVKLFNEGLYTEAGQCFAWSYEQSDDLLNFLDMKVVEYGMNFINAAIGVKRILDDSPAKRRFLNDKRGRIAQVGNHFVLLEAVINGQKEPNNELMAKLKKFEDLCNELLAPPQAADTAAEPNVQSNGSDAPASPSA
ncbi:hypothetical protein HY468_04455 [Candidatus Roizmanbacteria bacterium]|nr:hypothetical protein [Candidatus Roizmanbacteria bacterium]